jgi:hypothetical protein
MFVSWIWIILSFAFMFGIVVLLTFWKKRRLECASFISVLALTLLLALWLKSLGTHARAVISFDSNGFSTDQSQTVGLSCSAGGLSISFMDSIIFKDPALPTLRGRDNPDRKLWLTCSIRAPAQYPEVRDPLFKRWGFQLTWFGEPAGIRQDVRLRHLWAFICPAWFPIPFLLVIPGMYAGRWIRKRKFHRRLAAGCCAHCGFDLRAHKPGEKCPECSTLIPDSHRPAISPDIGTSN